MDNGLTLEERMVLWEQAHKEIIEFIAGIMAEEDAHRADEQAENAA